MTAPVLKPTLPPPIIKHHHSSGTDYSANVPASFFSRFAAASVDGVLTGLLSQGASFLVLLFWESKVASTLAGFSLTMIYCMWPLVKWGATPGKRLLKIRVIRQDGSAPLSVKTVLVRETVGKILSALLLMGGYLMALTSKRRLSLHDRLAGTCVVREDE